MALLTFPYLDMKVAEMRAERTARHQQAMNRNLNRVEMRSKMADLEDRYRLHDTNNFLRSFDERPSSAPSALRDLHGNLGAARTSNDLASAWTNHGTSFLRHNESASSEALFRGAGGGISSTTIAATSNLANPGVTARTAISSIGGGVNYPLPRTYDDDLVYLSEGGARIPIIPRPPVDIMERRVEYYSPERPALAARVDYSAPIAAAPQFIPHSVPFGAAGVGITGGGAYRGVGEVQQPQRFYEFSQPLSAAPVGFGAVGAGVGGYERAPLFEHYPAPAVNFVQGGGAPFWSQQQNGY